MEIVIAAGGMPFGPNTLTHKSLGGSETAVLMLAKQLRQKGHYVTVFCQLPEQGQPDFVHNGEECEDGVRWVHINNFQNFASATQIDLLIASRDPRLVAVPSQAKKKVLWCHDIATHRGLGLALDQIGWAFDEIWAVSKWYAKQIHKVTGYPKKRIKVVTNGIVPVETIPAPRSEYQLVYAARPERGLVNLIREGGIMERLPEYELKVAMYAHFPEDMRDFYEWVFARMEAMPNVEMVGGLPQQQMRQLIHDSAAYIYPTQFEETSCILARECIEQGTPMLTTRVGALPETLGDCGIFFEDYSNVHSEPGDDDWCAAFAEFVSDTLSHWSLVDDKRDYMKDRKDLYWDTACNQVLDLAKPEDTKLFSKAWSLVQDGDVIPAYALLTAQKKLDAPSFQLSRQIEQFYPFILDESDPNYETLASYYKRFYAFKKPEINYGIDYARGNDRFNAIKEAVAKYTKPGDNIVEYGCGEGHISGPLAKDFPDRTFIAFDQVQQNVDMVNAFDADFGTSNLKAHRVDTPQDAMQIAGLNFDLAICVEVLEHCVRPWEVATAVEDLVKPHGRVVITTPIGAWEPLTFEKKKHEWMWRNHIWHLDKAAARDMFGNKPDFQMMSLVSGHDERDGRVIGQLFYTFEADHREIKPLLPMKKALIDAHHRQTIAVAAICMNDENTIMQMLHSLDRKVQFVQFAMGPSTDRTRELIETFFDDHPHMGHKIIDVQKIEPPTEQNGELVGGFGFDDARNASIEGLYETFDWVLWMDTDEYLSGQISKYLRHNHLDGYLVPQHHFTVAPRGAPVQIDRPARLMRSSAGYIARGHIHEHFEIAKGGPGNCYMPPDIDLGHVGYVNEGVRQNRFQRNWPFLCWDHETDPERKLHKFLWFRDIIHRMRWVLNEGNREGAIALAREAETYYDDNWKDMASFGMGTLQAIQYLSEARKFLGRGTAVKVDIQIDENQSATIEGHFVNSDEITRVVKQMLDPEFKRRGSKYF